MANTLLIDVRSPEEYETGFLPNAININYMNIGQLASSADVSKEDKITLYCRSGRRSAIALQTLISLGFQYVRDIGSLEDAARILAAEAKDSSETVAIKKNPATANVGPIKAELEDSWQRLLDGLRRIEGRGEGLDA